MKLQDLLRMTEGFHKTSTITNLKDHSITFAKNQEWFEKLFNTCYEIYTIVPRGQLFMPENPELMARIRPVAVNDPLYVFIKLHNAINEGKTPKRNVIGDNVEIDSSAIIGAEGMRWQRVGGKLIKMKHMGNVVLQDNVEVGPLSVIHRGTIDSTIIGSNTKIGSNNSIGHNVHIGSGVMITAGVVIAGSVRIDNNCWIGINASIRDNIRIHSNVRVGMGAVVTRNLKTPGTYAGCPATRIGEWDGSL